MCGLYEVETRNRSGLQVTRRASAHGSVDFTELIFWAISMAISLYVCTRSLLSEASKKSRKKRHGGENSHSIAPSFETPLLTLLNESCDICWNACRPRECARASS